MYRVNLYARTWRECRVKGMSTREASRVFGVDRETVSKTLSFSVPPGYHRSAPPRRPKLGPFTGIIDRPPGADRLGKVLQGERWEFHGQFLCFTAVCGERY